MKAHHINQIGAAPSKLVALQYFSSEISISLLGANLSALMVGAIIYPNVPHHLIVIWLLSILVMSAIRFYQAKSFLKLQDPQEKRYYPRFMFTSLIASLIWGSGLVFFLPYLDTIQQAYLTIVMLALASGASVKMPQDMFLLFLVGIGGPCLSWMFLSENIQTETLGLFFAFGLLILWLTSNQFDKKLYEAITKGIENTSLLEKMVIQAQALEQSEDSIIIMDDQGRVQYVNPSYLKVSGYTEQDIIGKIAPFLKAKPQQKQLLDNLWHTISQQKSWSSRILFERKNQKPTPSLLSISPVYNVNNTLTHLIAIQKDLSQYEALEHRLQHAKKMEALGTLTSGLAHDFNNTLANISVTSFLISQCCSNDKASQYIQRLNSTTQDAAELIKKLLRFARKEEVSLQPIIIESYLQETIHKITESIPKSIAIDLQCQTDNTTVQLCPTLFQHVLHNLINNAADALKDTPSPKINIQTTYQHQHIHISIHDNGSGIEAEKLEHIFDPFFTTKEKGKGTGLGLAMAYNTIQSHHGEITVESAAGQGTTFHICLPTQQHQ